MIVRSAPIIDAEIAYRTERIAADYARAQGWARVTRRAGRWARSRWGHGPARPTTARRAAAH